MTHTTPGDYNSEGLQVAKSIRDDLWRADMRLDKTQAPAWWAPFRVPLQDHTGTEQTVFLGLIPGSSYVLRSAGNKATAVGYDAGWYLSQQYLRPEQLNVGLEDDPSLDGWDDFVRRLLGWDEWQAETGVEPYRIEYPGSETDSLRFSFQTKTTKMQAIKEIAQAVGFIFEIKPRWTGTEWRSSAYFMSKDDIDLTTYGLDLPAPVTFTHPDPHIVDFPAVDDLGGERYNRIIVRGHNSRGTWYTAIEESPNVTAGTAIPREYYEESSAYNTQAKCDARAVELFALYNIVCKTVTVTIRKRHDLQLYQLVAFSGYDPCLDISEDYYRIIEIRHIIGPDKDLVQITCTPDRLGSKTWYQESSRADIVTETELIAEEVASRIPAGEPGTVTAVLDDQVTVSLDKGGTVVARAVGTSPTAGDQVFIQPQADGTYVLAGGGGGGGAFSPAPSDLDMQNFKIKSTTGALRLEVYGTNKIIFSRGTTP